MLLVPRRARNRRAAVRILTSLSNCVCSAADTQKRNCFYVVTGSQIVGDMGRFCAGNDRPECRPQTMNRMLVCVRDHYKHQPVRRDHLAPGLRVRRRTSIRGQITVGAACVRWRSGGVRTTVPRRVSPCAPGPHKSRELVASFYPRMSRTTSLVTRLTSPECKRTPRLNR
jgi:hypothetical protein